VRTYFDTSALAKRYVRESGTEAVLGKCWEADEIVISAICLPELVSAFNPLRREGSITSEPHSSLKRGAIADFRAARFVEISPAVLQETSTLPRVRTAWCDGGDIATASRWL
jgi:uncharacterized protein